MAERNIYIAIMRAASRGDGLRLSADEVLQLSRDDAIATYAANCLVPDEWEHKPITSAQGRPGTIAKPRFWANIDPYRKRTAANGAA